MTPFDQLYSDLKNEYSSLIDRRKTLTGQATSLMSFAGIIQTVLVALIIALATNSNARAFIGASPYYSPLLVVVTLGFVSYMATAILSLYAFREVGWIPVPQMEDGEPLDTAALWKLLSNSGEYDQRHTAIQMGVAINNLQGTNERKFQFLHRALVALVAGIALTAIGGLLLLAPL